jgi:hypothetical protein
MLLFGARILLTSAANSPLLASADQVALLTVVPCFFKASVMVYFSYSNHYLSPCLIALCLWNRYIGPHKSVGLSAIILKSEDRRKDFFGWQELSRKY